MILKSQKQAFGKFEFLLNENKRTNVSALYFETLNTGQMRKRELTELRDKAVLKRFGELKEEYKHKVTILKKMELEFFLTKGTLLKILYAGGVY